MANTTNPGSEKAQEVIKENSNSLLDLVKNTPNTQEATTQTLASNQISPALEKFENNLIKKRDPQI
ncbi:MAG: hypothetical protein HG424_000075 [candidate division SR1 bacterium]|nr:hypothetical protein [candidate division SR1 bacterium]